MEHYKKEKGYFGLVWQYVAEKDYHFESLDGTNYGTTVFAGSTLENYKCVKN